MSETPISQPRTVTGQVCSAAGDKTIVVKIERQVRHPKYKKYIRRSSKMHAHDENNECVAGDKVTIVESRPYSKKKTWRLLNIVEKSN